MSRKRRGFCSCASLTPGYPGAPGHEMGWFERLLIWLLPHFDIVKTIDGPHCGDKSTKAVVVYLRRFYIWRSSWIGMNFGDLYLHKIYRSDDDPDPHDHPWDFRTFILKGGYYDEAWVWESYPKIWGEGPGRRHRLYAPGAVVRAPATRFRARSHIHRVILDNDEPAWTLVWTTGYTRTENGDADWYFITEKGPVFWRKYLGLEGGEEHGG